MVTMIGDELPSHSCSGWPHVGLCPTFLVLSYCACPDALGLEIFVFVLCCADRVVFSEKDIGVSTALTVNGRLFVSPYEHLDALVSKLPALAR